MTRIVSQSHPENIVKPLAIAHGGTGAKDSVSALAALGGVDITSIGQPGGLVPINAVTKIPNVNLPEIIASNINECSIMGPSVLYNGSLTAFWITDYDINKSYTTSVNIGSVAPIEADVIGITIPFSALEGQNCTLTINGYDYVFPIVASHIIAKNVIIGIATLASEKQVFAEFQIIGGRPIGNVRIQQELSLSNTFSVIAQTISYTDLLESERQIFSCDEVIAGLVGLTTYYSRIRLEVVDNLNTVLFNSEWVTNNFTTETVVPTNVNRYLADQAAEYVTSNYGRGHHMLSMSDTGNLISTSANRVEGFPAVQTLDLTNVNYDESWAYGTYTPIIKFPESPAGITSAVSGNGDYLWLVIQDSNYSTANPERYKRNTTNQQFEHNVSTAIIGVNNTTTYGAMGVMCTNYVGDVICIYQYAPTHQPNGGGVVNAHFMTQDADGVVSTYNTYSILPATIEPTRVFNEGDFGKAMAMSSDGNTLVISCRSTQHANGKLGAVYVLSRNGDSYELNQMLESASLDRMFGHDVTISHDGTTIAVSEVFDIDGETILHGRVTIFKLINENWVQQAVIPFIDQGVAGVLSGSGFGFAIKLNSNGNILAIGAPYAQKIVNNVAQAARTGVVYAFAFENNVWSCKSKLYDSVDIDGAELGFCVDISADGALIAATSPKTWVPVLSIVDAQSAPNIVIFR